MKNLHEETSGASSALIFEAEEYDELNMAESGDLVIEVVADPGASDHIVSPSNIPGIETIPSRASRNGGGYITASGDRIGNGGQCALQLEVAEVRTPHTAFSKWHRLQGTWCPPAGFVIQWGSVHQRQRSGDRKERKGHRHIRTRQRIICRNVDGKKRQLHQYCW